VLAVASGIYTYLGVSSLLDDTGALSFIAAMAYSVAVSVAIFVFWSYLLRLLPAVRSMGARIGLFLSMCLGSLAIIAMSSWLNAAALAGAAAVEQHLATTVHDYQNALERANTIAVSGQGAVFRLLQQKSDELASLESQIASQQPFVDAAFAEGNAILSRMRALTVEAGPVEPRSVLFSEEAVRLANIITQLRQLSVAPLVVRAAQDLSASVVTPQLRSTSDETRQDQAATIDSVLTVLGQRAETLRLAAEAVNGMTPPSDTVYTPISTADAVIKYAANFIPSWAGAIAIDLLPAVLVLIMTVTQAAIRAGRDGSTTEDMMTLADLRAAMIALKEVEGHTSVKAPEPIPEAHPIPGPKPVPLTKPAE
jgi:hypothetical protein